MTGRQILQVVAGVILVLALFVFGLYCLTNIFSPSSKEVENKKIETVSKNSHTQWKKKVDKTLKNHEERITGVEERQEKDADAITDLQSQINDLKGEKPEKNEIEEPEVDAKEKPKSKYPEGWNSKKTTYKRFPQNF
ncbi:MAG: hypothetical protein LiPW41_398 [Parcubacteria group bacterium LiPW_41]|nr:MAG: hypothetical protein LiPW41_398 [Parcubacteria group bacterium LiPW_41]